MPRVSDFTGERRDEFLALREAKRYIAASVYFTELAALHRREAAAIRQAMKERRQKIKAEAQAYVAGVLEKSLAEKKAADAAKAEKKAAKSPLTPYLKKTALKVFNFKQGDSVHGDVGSLGEGWRVTQYLVKHLKGQTVMLTAEQGFREVRRLVFTVPATQNLTHVFLSNTGTFFFWGGSAETESIFYKKPNGEELPEGTLVTITVTEFAKPPPKKLIQQYRDGPVHCVADPLAKLWEKLAAEASNKDSAKRYRRTARAIREFGDKYPEGIPEGAPMEEMAKICCRRIVIKDILGGTFQEYNAKSSRIVHFTNTRENHIDVGHLCLEQDCEIVTDARMMEILEQHANEFFLLEGTVKEPRVLRSLRGSWRVANAKRDIYDRHNKANGIGFYGVNAVKRPELNAFLKAAAVVNAAPVKLSNAKPTGHLDLEHAYTQHALTDYYAGFIGHVTQARRLPGFVGAEARAFIAAHLGIYRFRVLNNPVELLRQLGVNGVLVLPGPEVLLYIDMGVEVELLSAVFGKRFDLTYSKEMIETKSYQPWAGCMSYDREMAEFNFHGSWSWAQHLSATFGEDRVRWNPHAETVTVLVPKRINYTKHHILAFITSYTRINIVEAMVKISKTATLCEVVLDGIFYNGVADALPKFNTKPIIAHNFTESWFSSQAETDDSWMPMLEDVTLLSNCVLAGAGGCGKTTSILTDAGFNDVLYVVPTHRLGQSMREKHAVRYATIHKLVGAEGRSLKDEGFSPAVGIIDEVTMCPAGWIEKAVSMYPDTLWFIAGDVAQTSKGFMWFQCRNGKPGDFSEIWRPSAEWGWKYYFTDFRSRDEELKQFKREVRAQMVEIFTDGGLDDARKLSQWVMENYATESVETAAEKFQHGDTWIAGTHQTNKILLAHGVVSGYVSPQKEMSREAVVGWEKRGSFTTHGFQGQTLSEGRVFVSVGDSFELAMFYTAISRARSFSQLVLVE